MSEIPLDRERKKNVHLQLTEEERSQLKSLSGQMLWVSTQTRPDMAFETCAMSNAGKKATIQAILDANKAVRKMKNTNYVKLKFPDLGQMAKAKIVVHADATYASLPDGSSQGAYLVFLEGKGQVAPVLWQSKKLKRVTKSPLASETLAMGEAVDAALLIANLMKEWYRLQILPKIECYSDSKSLRDAVHTR